MTRWTTLAGASLISLALASPHVAFAQNARRAGGSARSAPADAGHSSGGARPRSSSGGGGVSQAPAQREPARVTSARSSSDPGDVTARSAGQVQTVRRTAQPRAAYGPTVVAPAHRYYSYPYYSHYYPRYYYPYYSYSPYYPVYPIYSPWYFGPGFGLSLSFGFGTSYGYPYSYGYGPYSSYPYVPSYGSYAPYSSNGPSSSYSSSYSSSSADLAYGSVPGYEGDRASKTERRETGSIRLKANPREAKVYIDGALVGTVDDFDGLTGHLTIEAGVHQLEIRADGYQGYEAEITVAAGKTTTERVNLKKL